MTHLSEIIVIDLPSQLTAAPPKKKKKTQKKFKIRYLNLQKNLIIMRFRLKNNTGKL